MAILNILWTGGLDSTYAVVSLVHQTNPSVLIQPFYVIDKNRKSYKLELNAIKRITDLINCKEKATRVLPAKIFRLEEIEINPEIKNAYCYLKTKYSLGSQYAWLASLAENSNLTNLIIGLEMSPRSKAYTAITSESDLQTFSAQNIDFYRVIENDNAISLIMKRFCFMKDLFCKTKEEEVEQLNKFSYGDIVQYTWFCHNPIFGLPCGHCNPCRDALNEGMSWRVPLTGRALGTLRIPFQLGKRVLSKIGNSLLKKQTKNR